MRAGQVLVVACAAAVGAVITAPLVAGSANEQPVVFEVVEQVGTFAAFEVGQVTGRCPDGLQVFGGATWVGPTDDPFAFTSDFTPTADNTGWSETASRGTPFTITTRGYCIGVVTGPAPPLQFQVIDVSETFPAGAIGTVTATCPAGTVVFGGSAWVGPPTDPYRSTRDFEPTPDNTGWHVTFPSNDAPLTITTRGTCIGETTAPSASIRFAVVDVAGTFPAGEIGTVTGACPPTLVVSDGAAWVGPPTDPYRSTRDFEPTPDNTGWHVTFPSNDAPLTITTRGYCIGEGATPTTTTTTTATTTTTTTGAPSSDATTTANPGTSPSMPPAHALAVTPTFAG